MALTLYKIYRKWYVSVYLKGCFQQQRVYSDVWTYLWKCRSLKEEKNYEYEPANSFIHIFITWINSYYNVVKILQISPYKWFSLLFSAFCLWTTEILIHLQFIWGSWCFLPMYLAFFSTGLLIFSYWFVGTIYMSNKLQLIFPDLAFAFYTYL